jgi:hypothetical protein
VVAPSGLPRTLRCNRTRQDAGEPRDPVITEAARRCRERRYRRRSADVGRSLVRSPDPVFRSGQRRELHQLSLSLHEPPRLAQNRQAARQSRDVIIHQCCLRLPFFSQPIATLTEMVDGSASACHGDGRRGSGPVLDDGRPADTEAANVLEAPHSVPARGGSRGCRRPPASSSLARRRVFAARSRQDSPPRSLPRSRYVSPTRI